jgi:hypothetical protein
MTADVDAFLAHYGVEGMKWGVRKDRGFEGKRTTNRKIAKLDKKWAKKAASHTTFFGIYNQMAEKMNSGGIDQINNSPAFKGKQPLLETPDGKYVNPTLAKKYFDTYSNLATQYLNQGAKDFGLSPSGKGLVFQYEVDKQQLPSFSIVHIDEAKHADIPDGSEVDIQVAIKDGYIVGMKITPKATVSHADVDEFLAHYGVLGMKWGKRKAEIPGVSNKTNREARKDANEFAKAKMFYGEGAGTRRKLIKAKVESKAKKDPTYKKAFDHHLSTQDLGKRASQARGERKRKDVVAGTAKTARGVKNLALGTGAPVALSAVIAFAAYKNPAVRRIVKNAGATAYSKIKNIDFSSFRGATDNGSLWL